MLYVFTIIEGIIDRQYLSARITEYDLRTVVTERSDECLSTSYFHLQLLHSVQSITRNIEINWPFLASALVIY